MGDVVFQRWGMGVVLGRAFLQHFSELAARAAQGELPQLLDGNPANFSTGGGLRAQTAWVGGN